jgi:hypothetical protein
MDLVRLNKLIKLVSISAVYVPDESEGMRINYWQTTSDLETGLEPDELCFYCTGEESGEEFMIAYNDIDLATDMFYKLELVDTSDIS